MDAMALNGLVWVLGAVILVALVLGGVAVVGGVRNIVPGAASLAPEGWVAEERTRLLAASLLGAIAAAASAVSGVRAGAWGWLFVAGSVGAVATLLAAVLLPVSPAEQSGGGRSGAGRPRWVKPGIAGALAVALVGGAAWFAAPSPEGGWGLPHRFVAAVHHRSSGEISVEYGSGYLRPWAGWPDAVVALVLVAAVLLLWVVLQRRMGTDAVTPDEGAAEELTHQRVGIIEGVITGGLLAQVGVTGFLLGSPLATLTDVDPVPTSEGIIASVASQPHATVGVLLAIAGVVALVLAITQLVFAMLGLARLGVFGRLVNSP